LASTRSDPQRVAESTYLWPHQLSCLYKTSITCANGYQFNSVQPETAANHAKEFPHQALANRSLCAVGRQGTVEKVVPNAGALRTLQALLLSSTLAEATRRVLIDGVGGVEFTVHSHGLQRNEFF